MDVVVILIIAGFAIGAGVLGFVLAIRSGTSPGISDSLRHDLDYYESRMPGSISNLDEHHRAMDWSTVRGDLRSDLMSVPLMEPGTFVSHDPVDIDRITTHLDPKSSDPNESFSARKTWRKSMEHDVEECPDCGADYMSHAVNNDIQYCQFCGWVNEIQKQGVNS